jgi:hypothetical protein
MPELVAHARAVGDSLAALEDVSVVPDPPQAAMLHVHVRRPLAALKEAALELAERTGVWFAGGWAPTEDPAVQRAELSIGVPALDVAPEEAAALYSELLGSVPA